MNEASFRRRHPRGLSLLPLLAAIWTLFSLYGLLAQASESGALTMSVHARCPAGATAQAQLVPSQSRVVVQGQAVEAQLTAVKSTGERCQARATGSLGETAMNLVIRRIACQGEEAWSPPSMFAGVIFARAQAREPAALEFTNTSLGYCGSEPLYIKLIPRQ